jgi:membrane-associated phospholipid phosphatase
VPGFTGLFGPTPRFLAVVVVCLAVAWGASAQDEVSCDGPLQADSMRFPHMRVVPRTWRDLAAVPASVVAWDDADWARFGAFTMPSAAMMWPTEPSFDVWSYEWVKRNKKPALDRLFFKIKTVPESIFLAGYGAVLFSTAYLTKNEQLFEYGTLALETIAIAQFYHSVTKLLIGREGPHQARGEEPRIYGPTRLFFPAGTPSGHITTDFSMLFLLADYWGKWPLYVLAGAAGIYLGASLVYEGQHYVSDVVLGAGMGLYIARWIVRHRSSRYRCATRRRPLRDRMSVLPVFAGKHGMLLTLSLQH